MITYDLNTPGKDYADLYKSIGSISLSLIHPLESVWIVESNLSLNQIYSSLKGIDSNDRVLIIKMNSGEYYGYLSKTDVDWLASKRF